MGAPATTWKEIEPPDEAARVAALVEELVAAQKRISQRQGVGRALHRKQVLGLSGSWEVLAGLPAHAAHGVFAAPRKLDVLVRLSNGSLFRQKDSTPDIRGLAVKILGVEGKSALGQGDVHSQDFLFINQKTFSSRTGIEFLEFVAAAAKGQGALLGFMARKHKLRMFAELKRSLAVIGKPFQGFANETFGTVNPLACGPYAMKLRLVPPAGQPVNPNAREDWARDILPRVQAGELVYGVEAQFFVDENVTPIEASNVEWLESNAPWMPVARLTIHRQDPTSDNGKALQERIEKGTFDPWSGVMEHRPLGSIMRARKQAYYKSQQARQG